MSKAYDYLIVGAGLFGAVFAHEATKAGRKCLVVDKRDHIAGNIYTEQVEGINVHRYGAHIFHTNNKQVWDYVNQFAVFNRYTNSPVANYHGELYNLPFNMNTFNKMWGVVTPAEAAAKIAEQRAARFTPEPKTWRSRPSTSSAPISTKSSSRATPKKQWGRPCDELPAFIIKRLPVRLTFDNNYFNALYQGIPNGGYTQMVANMLKGIEVRLGVNYLKKQGGARRARQPRDLHRRHRRLLRLPARRAAVPQRAVRGPKHWTARTTRQRGHQLYRRRDPLHPHHRAQALRVRVPPSPAPKRSSAASIRPSGNPATNRTTRSTTSTTPSCTPATRPLADAEPHVVFGGRLGEYRYYDMDKVIESALACVEGPARQDQPVQVIPKAARPPFGSHG